MAPRHRALPDARRFQAGDVRLGYISGFFGVSGEVRLFLHNRDSEFLRRRRELILVGPEGARREAAIKARQGAGGRVVGRIEGVESREAAAGLMDWELVVPQASLPALPPGQWYHRDLLGAEVITTTGTKLGRLVEIHDTATVEMWVVRGPDGDRYIPLLGETVQAVEPGAQITVHAEAVLRGEP